MKKRVMSLLSVAAVAALAVGSTASVGRAAIAVTVTDVGHPQVANGTTAAQSSAFEAYVVRLTTNDGGAIGGVDIGSIPTRGIFGTSMLQRAVLSTDPDSGDPVRTLTPQATADNSTVSVSDFDSHLLPAAAARIDTVVPNEDNNGTNLTNSPADSGTADYGTGTFLQGVFGVALASQSGNFALAYIVLPVGSTATLLGTAAENGGTLSNVSQVIATTIGGVPEPTSLALVGLGAVGALRRRRTA